MVQIFKGDDTDFANLNEVVVTIRTELDLAGFLGEFHFQGVVKRFTTEETASKVVHFNYTEAETKTFMVGRCLGTFILYDAQSRPAQVQKILVEVLPHRDCSGVEPSAVTIDIENVYDYQKLKNRPKVGGVTLEGDKTLDALGAQAKLVSGTNIKTVNNQSLLGSGNIEIEGGGGDGKLDADSAAEAWTAKAYGSGAFVSHKGKAYLSNAATEPGDEPGVSGKWTVAKLPVVFSTSNPSLKETIAGTVTVSDEGAATDVVRYIKINGVEKRFAGGVSISYDPDPTVKRFYFDTDWGSEIIYDSATQRYYFNS